MHQVYTATDKKKVLTLRAKGTTYREIAEKTGISTQTVANWIKYEILRYPTKAKKLDRFYTTRRKRA